MADTDIGDRALILIGEVQEVPLDALSDRPNDLALLYTPDLKSVLAMAPWPFAMKRSRLTAAGILDCSSRVITITGNTAPTADTIADDGNGFVTGNFLTGDRVLISGSGSNDGSYSVETAAAGQLTTGTYEAMVTETLTNDTDLKLYAQPAFGWAYKYAQPSDCIKVWSVNEQHIESQPNWSKEGKFVVTDEIDNNDQIAISYVQYVTNTDSMSDLFKECFAIKLASSLALVVKEDMALQKKMEKHLDYKLKQAFAQGDEGYVDEGNNEQRGDSSWMQAGR